MVYLRRVLSYTTLQNQPTPNRLEEGYRRHFPYKAYNSIITTLTPPPPPETILLLTLLYLLCNLSYLLVLLLVGSSFPYSCYLLLFGAGVVLPLLNAALNPAVLLSRGRLLKGAGLRGLVGRVGRGVESAESTRRVTTPAPDPGLVQLNMNTTG